MIIKGVIKKKNVLLKDLDLAMKLFRIIGMNFDAKFTCSAYSEVFVCIAGTYHRFSAHQ